MKVIIWISIFLSSISVILISIQLFQYYSYPSNILGIYPLSAINEYPLVEINTDINTNRFIFATENDINRLYTNYTLITAMYKQMKLHKDTYIVGMDAIEPVNPFSLFLVLRWDPDINKCNTWIKLTRGCKTHEKTKFYELIFNPCIITSEVSPSTKVEYIPNIKDPFDKRYALLSTGISVLYTTVIEDGDKLKIKDVVSLWTRESAMALQLTDKFYIRENNTKCFYK